MRLAVLEMCHSDQSSKKTWCPAAEVQSPKSLVFSSFQLSCRELLCLSSRPWVKEQWRKRAASIHSLKKEGYKVAAISGPTWHNSVGVVLPAGLPDGWLRLFQNYVTILLLSLLGLSPASFLSQVLFLNTYFIPQIHFSICFLNIQTTMQIFPHVSF